MKNYVGSNLERQYSDFYKKDCNIKVLGPVGDVVEHWTLKGAFIQAANFNDLI